MNATAASECVVETGGRRGKKRVKNYSWPRVPQGALNINAAVLLSDPLRRIQHALQQQQLHRTRSIGALSL